MYVTKSGDELCLKTTHSSGLTMMSHGAAGCTAAYSVAGRSLR